MLKGLEEVVSVDGVDPQVRRNRFRIHNIKS